MVVHELTDRHILKRLNDGGFAIRIIQPPPLHDPTSMATPDATFNAVCEGFTEIECGRALNYLHSRAEKDNSPLWKFLYAWTSKCTGVYQPVDTSSWKQSFSGTVHCEAIISAIAKNITVSFSHSFSNSC
jgi:hypothetical protein